MADTKCGGVAESRGILRPAFPKADIHRGGTRGLPRSVQAHPRFVWRYYILYYDPSFRGNSCIVRLLFVLLVIVLSLSPPRKSPPPPARHGLQESMYAPPIFPAQITAR